MRADKKTDHAPLRRSLAVIWQDCVWQPRIVVRRPPPPLDFHFSRRNFILSKPMKTILPPSRRHRDGFTLVELLTVIAIIGILAALLFPVLAAAKKHALMTKAHLEAGDLVTAIQGYDSAYGRFPVSTNAQMQASPANRDFTYGANGTASTFTLVNSPALAYDTNNCEVIAILMDMTNYPNGSPTVNINHVKNPQQTKFLSAKLSGFNPASGGQPEPGVDVTGVYRDPWGNPYIITMDLNYNDMCVDAFYGKNLVSGGGGSGLNGLIHDSSVVGVDNWAFRGKVMVWSAGPDGAIGPTTPANQGVNQDNILSWK